MRSPLLGVAACWAFGILLGSSLQSRSSAAEWLIAAAAVALLGSLLALRRPRPAPAIGLTAAGFIVAGALGAVLFAHRFPPDHIRNLTSWGFGLDHPIATEATVESVPVRTPTGFEFDAEILNVKDKSAARVASGKILLRMRVPAKAASWAALETLDLKAGDIIRAPVHFYHPSTYRNPGSFNYGQWLESVEDVTWEGTIQDPLDVRKLSGRGISWASSAVARVRSRLLAGIDRVYPPWSAEGQDGAVLKAVLLGDRSALNSATIESFRKSGLYHLLVISGLHVGLLAALALMLFRWLGLGETWRGGALLLMLVGYALLVEQRAPTMRATLMIALYLMARYLYRDRTGLNAVGFAALILLVARPPWLFEAGFQLSFSAALLILAVVVPILERTTVPYSRSLESIEDVNRDASLAPRQAQFRLDLRAMIEFLKRKLAWLSYHPRLARGLVILPLKAVLWAVDLTVFSAILQIGLLMPMAESFHRITLAGIGLNTLAFPVMTVLLGLAVPTVILAATVPALAAIPGKLLAGIISILFWLTSVPRMPSWVSYRVPSPPAWVAWGFALSAVAVAWTLAQKRRRALAAAVVAFAMFAAFVAWYPFPPRIPSGEFEVTALDCGRGQATFLVLPDRTTALVGACGAEKLWWDAAAYKGRWDAGEDIVSPYLWSRGIKRIDILIAPDSRPGMLDGMAAVIRNFRPRELWMYNTGAGIGASELVRLVRAEDGRPSEVESGQVIREPNSSFEFLGSVPNSAKLETVTEEKPLGLRISSLEGSLMLLESGNGGERMIPPPSEAIRSDVMETMSRGASTFDDLALLGRVLPKLVVVSGGRWKRNDFETSEAPALAIKPAVVSTEQEGAITVELKNSRLFCYADEGSALGTRRASGSRDFSGYRAQ